MCGVCPMAVQMSDSTSSAVCAYVDGLKNGGSIDFVGGDCGCDFSLLAK